MLKVSVQRSSHSLILNRKTLAVMSSQACDDSSEVFLGWFSVFICGDGVMFKHQNKDHMYVLSRLGVCVSAYQAILLSNSNVTANATNYFLQRVIK